MKTRFTLLVIMLSTFLSMNAQIGQLPNQDFEIWTNPLTPDDWSTYESLYGTSQVGLVSKDEVDKFGPAVCSIKLRSDSVSFEPSQGVIPGIVSLGGGQVINNIPVFTGYPFTYRPDTILTLFKYSSPGVDTFTTRIRMKKAGVDLLQDGVLSYFILDNSNTWKVGQFILTPSYLTPDNPDTLWFQCLPSNSFPVKNSTLHVNEVLFQYKVLPNTIQEMVNRLNLSMYPNPAADVVNIKSDESLNGYKAVITDINGKLASLNYLEGNINSVNVSAFTNGTYIYRIADKMGNIIRQDRFSVIK